jgi:type IV secretion system protein TrbD
MTAELRTIPIRRVANRSNLFLGGDRELVMFAGLLAAALVFASADLLGVAVGIGLWLVGLYLLRLMARSDPLLRKVYLRQLLLYRAYYPARSSPWRQNSSVQEWRYK